MSPAKLRSLRPFLIRTFKFLLLLAVPILIVWNWMIALALLLFVNGKSLIRVLFGRLPLSVPKSSSDGPYTHVYKIDQLSYKLDVYYPSKGNPPFPAVVFAHGGGWLSGFRKQPNNISWYRFLNHYGFAVATVDYRYGYLYHINDILQDYEDSIEYIRKNAQKLKIGADKLLLMGLSAGGHLALYYATYHSYHNHIEKMRGIRGVVVWYAPSDLTDLWDWAVESLFARFSVVAVLKGLPSKNLEDYKLYSPITWVSKKMVPTFLVHGLSDGVVPAKSSIKTYKRLREEGVKAFLRLHPTGDHSFEFTMRDRYTIKILQDMIDFMHDAVTE
ncbi:MAG: alpha/beta hydrolase [Thermotogae bacterium]|nr:MAG: alpha/beta hydrolase [Thermotogota bacterium]